MIHPLFAGPRLARRRGFTLIELLVAMTVLLLLVVAMVLITNATSKATGLSNKLVDTATQGRLVFDCLRNDLAMLVKRPDVPFAVQNTPASGASNLLSLISGVPSYSTASATTLRNASAVYYQVNTIPNVNLDASGSPRLCLIRAGKAIPWTQTGFFGLDSTGVPISFTSQSFPTALQPTQNTDFDLVAAGVIRCVVGFQLYPDNQPFTLQDGSQSFKLPDGTKVTTAQGHVVYSPPVRLVTPVTGGAAVPVVDLSRVSAIVVGLVIIDLNSLRLLNASQVAELNAAFSITNADGTLINGRLPVPWWGTMASNVGLLPADVPLAARQSLRVFARSFPVTPFASRR